MSFIVITIKLFSVNSSVPIGRVGFPSKDLVENICGGMKTVASRIPRGWSSIQSVHIKSTDSIALPVFTSLPPGPTALPGLGEGPPEKIMKFSEV